MIASLQAPAAVGLAGAGVCARAVAQLSANEISIKKRVHRNRIV
jgi:hypothetical protein